MSQPICKIVELLGACTDANPNCSAKLHKCLGVHPCRLCVHKNVDDSRCAQSFYQLFWDCAHYEEQHDGLAED